MARQTYWKGYLKLSLVTCPVTMSPATSDAEKLRFHTLNQKTGERVVSQWIDAGTGKKVAEADEARGYPVSEERHIVLTDSELDAVALESTRTIDIEKFVPAENIGWIWLDRPYYLAPSDKVGAEAFAVIREAMAATRTVGISRLVLARRERAVLLKPGGDGITLWSLRFGDEVRPGSDYFGATAKPAAKTLGMVKKLIDTRMGDWDAKLMKDPVQDNLRKLVTAKQKGRKAPAAVRKEQPPGDNVVNIMDALKKSIAKG